MKEGSDLLKIEKISDNQIRCTLTREDLEIHHIKLSELAYGTDKARNLFQEMMQLAQAEVGFVVDNTPLMIEAIPMNQENIVLLITKVDDPEELDTRFSKFAPFKRDGSSEPLRLDGADDILGLFQKLRDAAKNHMPQSEDKASSVREASVSSQEKADAPAQPMDLIREYHFSSLEHVILASHSLDGFDLGDNSLYKSPSGGYRLVLHKSASTPEDFNRICNILSEYGSGKSSTGAAEAFLAEHGDLVTDHALTQLAAL